MSKLLLFLVILCGYLGPTLSRPPTRAGGIPCAACTIAVALVEQQAQYHNVSVAHALDRLCSYLPEGDYSSACEAIVDFFGPMLIDLLYFKLTPDLACHSLTFCKDEATGPQCHLFPPPQKKNSQLELGRMVVAKHMYKKNMINFPEFCDIPGVKYFCQLFANVFDNQKPAVDLDGDGFSTIEALRGTSWKGKDCSDIIDRFHPGAIPFQSDVEFDSNCNGIFGIDPETLDPYEDTFCAKSGQLGAIIFGDSASAHFHIPPEWVYPSTLNADVLVHLPYVVENEVDWPMMSAMTGFKNLTWPIVNGKIRSFYQRLHERNACNHRDYQNLCVNELETTKLIYGGDSSVRGDGGGRGCKVRADATYTFPEHKACKNCWHSKGDDVFDLQKHMYGLSRNQVLDRPAVAAIALVGNDVCNGYADTEAHMTTTDQMRDNMIKTLQFLDNRLPNGSHVLLIGLADGRYLYELLQKRFHPFGELNQDVTYPQFYTYLSCLQTSPCNGWMSTNATLRNITSQRAADLSVALSQLAKSHQSAFKNFDLNYIDCPIQQVLADWEKEHGKGTSWQLIEPVDGFHPNTEAERRFADKIYFYLKKHLPQYLGPINQHNARIKEIFGDQGGY